MKNKVQLYNSFILQAYHYLVRSLLSSLPSDVKHDCVSKDYDKLNSLYRLAKQGSSNWQTHQKPFVSIVMPVHINEPISKFQRAVTSLLGCRQGPPIEIIIVLNGHQTTQEIQASQLYTIAQNANFKILTCSYIDQPEYRKVERPIDIFIPRQLGLEAAQGEIVLNCDADNIFSPEWVNAYATAFKNNPKLTGAYGPVSFYGAVGPIGKILTWISIFAKSFKTLLFRYPPFAGHNHALRRKDALQIKKLYSNCLTLHENEIPSIIEALNASNTKSNKIVLVSEAVISTYFPKQTESLSKAFSWIVEATVRNLKSIGIVKRNKNN